VTKPGPRRSRRRTGRAWRRAGRDRRDRLGCGEETKPCLEPGELTHRTLEAQSPDGGDSFAEPTASVRGPETVAGRPVGREVAGDRFVWRRATLPGLDQELSAKFVGGGESGGGKAGVEYGGGEAITAFLEEDVDQHLLCYV